MKSVFSLYILLKENYCLKAKLIEMKFIYRAMYACIEFKLKISDRKKSFPRFFDHLNWLVRPSWLRPPQSVERVKLKVLLWSDFPPSFLGVSHRIPWNNENAVYRLQISALAPEIFKFEKCVNMQMRWLMTSYIQPNFIEPSWSICSVDYRNSVG